MIRVSYALLWLATCGLLAISLFCLDVSAPASNADSAKTDKDSKDSKSTADKQEYNSPPKGKSLVQLGNYAGQVTKSCDGKTFSMQVILGKDKKQEIEINLMASTKIRVLNRGKFDAKGNALKTPPGGSKGSPEDISSGARVVVAMKGTSDGKWFAATIVTVTGE